MKKFLYFMAIAYIASAPFVFFLDGESAKLASLVLTSGVLLAVFSRWNDVTELSLLGLKAKIEKALDETHATIEQVKELAKIMSVSSLANTARSGWWGGILEDQRLEIFDSTVLGLTQLGFKQKEIDSITQDYINCTMANYKSKLLGSQIPDQATQECHQEWLALRHQPVADPLHPDRLRAFFDKHIVMNDVLKKRIDGYDHYYKHHKFLDFEDYKSGSNTGWPRLTANAVKEP
jgi:hypothetical protein